MQEAFGPIGTVHFTSAGGQQRPAKPAAKAFSDGYLDSVSGFRVSKPVIGSLVLKERLTDGDVVYLHLKDIRPNREYAGRWATMAVLVGKTQATGKDGSSYSRWTLNDLAGKQVTLFLWRKAAAEHYKEVEGSLLLLWSPQVRADSGGGGGGGGGGAGFSLHVDKPEQLQRPGLAADFAFCRGTRKDGQRCTYPINRSTCEYCPYHAQSALRALSSHRSDMAGANLLQRQLLPQARAAQKHATAVATAAGRSVSATGMNALIAKPLPAALARKLPGGIAGSGRMLPAAGAIGGSSSAGARAGAAAATAGGLVAMARSTGAYGSEEDYGLDLAGGGGGAGGATAGGGAKRSYGATLLAGLHERQALTEAPEDSAPDPKRRRSELESIAEAAKARAVAAARAAGKLQRPAQEQHWQQQPSSVTPARNAGVAAGTAALLAPTPGPGSAAAGGSGARAALASSGPRFTPRPPPLPAHLAALLRPPDAGSSGNAAAAAPGPKAGAAAAAGGPKGSWARGPTAAPPVWTAAASKAQQPQPQSQSHQQSQSQQQAQRAKAQAGGQQRQRQQQGVEAEDMVELDGADGEDGGDDLVVVELEDGGDDDGAAAAAAADAAAPVKAGGLSAVEGRRAGAAAAGERSQQPEEDAAGADDLLILEGDEAEEVQQHQQNMQQEKQDARGEQQRAQARRPQEAAGRARGGTAEGGGEAGGGVAAERAEAAEEVCGLDELLDMFPELQEEGQGQGQEGEQEAERGGDQAKGAGRAPAAACGGRQAAAGGQAGAQQQQGAAGRGSAAAGLLPRVAGLSATAPQSARAAEARKQQAAAAKARAEKLRALGLHKPGAAAAAAAPPQPPATAGARGPLAPRNGGLDVAAATALAVAKGLPLPKPRAGCGGGAARGGATAAGGRPGGGGGAATAAPSAMEAAFGALLKAMPNDKADVESRYSELSEEAAGDAVLSMLEGLEARDALAAQLDSVMQLKVTAWHCATCERLSEWMDKRCRDEGHALSKSSTLKRFWKCDHCNARITTLGVRFPSSRCSKCNNPSLEFTACSMYRGPRDVKSSAGGGGGLAGKENLFACLDEHPEMGKRTFR
ncbi:hypothetical protein HXX76_010611 [Chlamydomonas incerta]|uniref:Protein MCM10 homolog n=1 Tax=Chlamydomonas incerta TaxID=51695 RepID=A0A835SU69_CHLIN|nr:hypothetical protein HXX76_010611 [Chlamydomonas incerta]|eukprot:KAG2429828.1 hypothetical protein HXX76_010611 [Chlamydomonas incerta]